MSDFFVNSMLLFMKKRDPVSRGLLILYNSNFTELLFYEFLLQVSSFCRDIQEINTSC